MVALKTNYCNRDLGSGFGFTRFEANDNIIFW